MTKGRESERSRQGLGGERHAALGRSEARRGEVPAGAVGSGRPIHHAVPCGIREGHAHTIAVCSGLHDGEESVTRSFRYKQLIRTPPPSLSHFPVPFSIVHLAFFFFFQEKQMKNAFDAEQAIFTAYRVSLK